MSRLLFYISSHGYGHLLRMAEVIQTLLALSPDVAVIVRTAAPAGLLPVHDRIALEEAAIDSPIGETPDALRIDPAPTIDALRELHRRHAQLVAQETAIVRAHRPRLLVSDMPWLAGYIAESAAVPCVAIGNFTWSWVLAPWLDADLRSWMQEGYGRMCAYHRLPFAHAEALEMFPSVLPAPLIVAPGVPRESARSAFGIPAGARVALLAFRGNLPAATVAAGAGNAPSWLFLTTDRRHAGAAENVLWIDGAQPAPFQSLLAASDAVVGKLGYGLVAACVARKCRLLYAPREGFREDALTAAGAAEFTCARSIPRDDLYGGHWGEYLDAVARDPMPEAEIDTSGATVCAQRLLAQA